jgi:hypothetical protein
VAHRRERAFGHGVARGAVSEHQESEMVWMCSKSGREEERESEVHGAVHSNKERSTLASYSGVEEAYQGVLKRARATRGGKGAVAKMEASLVQRGGQNACVQRARAWQWQRRAAWLAELRCRSKEDGEGVSGCD